jgi:hypothetical protein
MRILIAQSRNGTLPCLKQDWSVAVGLVIMSERELNRIEVLAQVDDGRLSVQNGANMLDIIKRQMFRLLKTYRTDGARETCWDIVMSDTTGPKPPLAGHDVCRDAASRTRHW